MNSLTFNEFCYKYCDRLYTPGLSEDEQSTGYLMLKKMVEDKIQPASLMEIKRWEDNPTLKELSSVPDIKYLRWAHPNLRKFIIKHWDEIKNLPL